MQILKYCCFVTEIFGNEKKGKYFRKLNHILLNLHNQDMQKLYFFYLIFIPILSLVSCNKEKEEILANDLNQERLHVANSIPRPAIIAHRGTCAWAPEETEAAMRWARNAGSTYLEGDLQRTKDGYLVLFHDLQLTRNSDIATKFPQLKRATIADLTLEELFKLDIGSWFNRAYPSKARASFKNLEIITLEDLIKIAEGFRIQRDTFHKRIYKKIDGRIITQYEPDPTDNGNRPGIYIETKEPDLYPGIEQDLKTALEKLGWYADNISDLKPIPTHYGRICTANTPARVVVQTFSQTSLQKLRKAFPRLIPMCYLIHSIKDEKVSKATYEHWIRIALEQGAAIIGPCICGKDDNFGDLLKPWMHDLIKENGLLIHAYTFKDEEQIANYINLTDGFFTDEADDLLSFLFKSGVQLLNFTKDETDGSQILDILGY